MTKTPMLTFMKTFHRLRNLTMNCYYIDFKFLHAAILWLQTIVGLKLFKSILIADLDYFFIDRDPKIEFLLHKRFIRSLSATKSLETLELSCPQDILTPCLFKRLVNIKNLMLHGSSISPKNALEHKKSFPLMKNLTALEMINIPKISSIIHILASIWNPERVMCLGFKLCARNPIDYNSFSQLKWMLRHFRFLKKFSLVIENSLINISILEVLQELPLEELNLGLTIKEGGYLTPLGSLIGGFKGLKMLKLTLQTPSNYGEDQNDLVNFLRNIKNLTQLHGLYLHIQRMPIEEIPKTTGVDKAIFALSEALLTLKNLIELDFECSEVSYRGNVKFLVKGLLERAPKMKKFALGFNREELTIEDLIEIIQLIREMKDLEELGLRGLKVLDAKFLLRLWRVIVEETRLKILDWSRGVIGVNKGFFLEILERTLEKKGIEKFVGNGMAFVGKGRTEEVIDLVEVVKRNESLKKMEVSGSLKKYLRNQEGFILEKWK